MWVALVVVLSPLGLGQGLEIGTCGEVSTAKPGEGQSYRGTVRNSDYGIRVTIPRELTGWGAAPTAPFHGFVIYLDQRGTSCINLDVGMVVNPDNQPIPPVEEQGGIPVRIGSRIGFRRVSHGAIGGKQFESVVVVFRWKRGDETYGLALTLITPTLAAKETEAVFERLVSSLRFQ